MPEPQLVTAEQARSLHVSLQQDRRSWVSVEIPDLVAYCLTVIQQAEHIAAVLALHTGRHWCFRENESYTYDETNLNLGPCPTARALGVTGA